MYVCQISLLSFVLVHWGCWSLTLYNAHCRNRSLSSVKFFRFVQQAQSLISIFFYVYLPRSHQSHKRNNHLCHIQMVSFRSRRERPRMCTHPLVSPTHLVAKPISCGRSTAWKGLSCWTHLELRCVKPHDDCLLLAV